MLVFLPIPRASFLEYLLGADFFTLIKCAPPFLLFLFQTAIETLGIMLPVKLALFVDYSG